MPIEPRPRVLIVIAIWSGLLLGGVIDRPPAMAADPDEQMVMQPDPAPPAPEEEDPDAPVKLLGSGDPSHFALARENGETGSHIELFLSIEYPLFKEPLNSISGQRWNLYFNFNGKFDFFRNSRDSSPLITRLQNPGLILEYRPQQLFYDTLVAFRTGYFHESNGQTIDTLEEYQTTADARDYVSRGWDYIPLELEFRKPVPAASLFHDFFKGFYVTFRGRYFLPKQIFEHDKEDEVFWEARTEQPRIEDYDGIRLRLSKTYHPSGAWLPGEVTLKALFRSGYHDLNFSQRYEVTTRVWGLPIYLYYFDGYGTNLSTYHQKGSSFGGGFEFR